MAACLSGVPLSPKPTPHKLATFHKQFHRLVTQLDVYWKITDFPRAILVPDWGGEVVAHIIDLYYNWSPVSIYAFIYGSFALKYMQRPLCFCLQCLDASLGLRAHVLNPEPFATGAVICSWSSFSRLLSSFQTPMTSSEPMNFLFSFRFLWPQ